MFPLPGCGFLYPFCGFLLLSLNALIKKTNAGTHHNVPQAWHYEEAVSFLTSLFKVVFLTCLNKLKHGKCGNKGVGFCICPKNTFQSALFQDSGTGI